MNFLASTDIKPADTINIMGFALTQEQLYIYTALIAAFILAVCGIGTLALNTYTSNLDSQKGSLEQQESTLQSELTTLQKDNGKIDIYVAAKQIDKNMLETILYYNSIGADIPQHVWLTAFYADNAGAYGISGETSTVDEVYLFFRNIKSQVADSNLILSKLSVDDNDGAFDIEQTKNAIYSFELSNPKYAAVARKKEIAAKKASANNEGGQANQENMEVPNLPALPGT